MSLPLTTGKGIRWSIAIIHNQAINSKRRYNRWSRDTLVMNTSNGNEKQNLETTLCYSNDPGFSEHEALLWLDTLPYLQRDVLRALYILCFSQSQVAQHLGISQQHVSRLRDKGLAKLRKELGVPCVTRK